MKRFLSFRLMLCALFTLLCLPTQAELVWKKGEALLTKASQITSNNTENGFPPSNLLRPESEGVGTNQIIWHSSWSNPGPLPAGTDTYLQVHLAEPQQHVIFTMIGSTWNQTYDTPTEMIIQAADVSNGDWAEVAHLTDMDKDFFGVMPDPIEEKPNINLLFIGNSITAGATLSNASTQAPPIVCRSLVEEATGVTTNVYNGGHSGITTFGYLPGRDDFTRINLAGQVVSTPRRGFFITNGRKKIVR